ncbi:MAG TPA: thiamine-phosphate kinase [Acidimicrobiales bacterium]|nr:thiamine-phosphate kinase [Acidimicrobiales bacterium]
MRGRYRSEKLTNEFALIGRLRERFADIGDDAAIVEAPDGPLLLAADTVVAGVHTPPDLPLEDVGWKAVVVNVSDIAAMGGRPLHLLVTVAAPPGTDLDRLFDGVAEASKAYLCPVVGGDLTAADSLVVTVAVSGTVDGTPVRRSGASPGEAIYVTGPLGAAAASGWTRRPLARVAEGVDARGAGATAMIDVSDGLVADLGHVADESGVGFALDEIPVAPGATLDQALTGGEDYELVFTAPVARLPVGFRIGVCTADPSERTLAGQALPVGGGWEHRF